MQSNHLTRLLVGGTTLALLNAALSVSVMAQPVSARELVAANANISTNTNASTSNRQSSQLRRHKPHQNQLQNHNQTGLMKANEQAGSGTLVAMASGGQSLGSCPLKHTDVQTEISGYIARVTVKQVFQNPFKDKIEAVYTFPLSENGAVDEMQMKVGTRVIKGSIKKREEARQIYDQARAHGYVASLLDQERTNIFTQSVANIEPGKEIEITIKYIETLPYEAGKFSFTFPTVVGPRFIPGEPVGKAGGGWANDTNQVPDASKITPNVVAEGQRAGHDISINVHLNAGMPVSQISSKLHEVHVRNTGSGQADISLTDKATIPNKDFVLSWNVAEDNLKSGYVTYRDPSAKDGAGYFTVMLIPPKRITPEKVAPKEMVFVIDCSGSQSGAPLNKAKETMRYILDHMNANDTFQIIAFNNTQSQFADKPQPVSAEMKAKARNFIDALQANGGTWMAPAVEKACAIPADGNRLRIVTFMTDGYVGNDYQVMGMIKKLRGKSRWFSFGTGNSVNRTLIDGMAKEGGGEAEYVLLNSSAEEVGKKFYDRISTPVLTDVEVKVDGVTAKEVYPKEVSDVWAEKPLYFKGKYIKGGPGTIVLKGFAAGKPYEQKLNVRFPESDTKNRGVASMWARAKVDRLMSEDWFGAQSGQANKEIKDEITTVALDHHILTQYTSFVAVDESRVTKGDPGKTVDVEVEMPDGVSREGVFGNKKDGRAMGMAQPMASLPSPVARRQMSTNNIRLKSADMGSAMMLKQKEGLASSGASYYRAPQSLSLAESSTPVSAAATPKANEQKAAFDQLSEKEADKKAGRDDASKLKPAKEEVFNTSKMSKALAAELISTGKNRSTTLSTKRKGNQYLFALTIKDLSVEIEKILKALGIDIVSKEATKIDAQGKKTTVIKAFVKLDKLEALAKQDFVLHIDLASDRK
ncbi:MAG: VIT and VWA domain-containing protein [Candidatus Melainabacteria bacterium]|nr:VIT and VWA domain-containing protein [Candidatus Melainabacteria bacterium]